MNFASVFSIASSFVLLGWLALALTPYRLRIARFIAIGVALVLAMLYAALIGAFWSGAHGGFGSLADVATLFAQPPLLLAGWVHYLAFDLLVGTWEREEAAAIGLPRLVLVPALGATFMFGPIGWLLFMAMRFVCMAMRASRSAAEPLPAQPAPARATTP